MKKGIYPLKDKIEKMDIIGLGPTAFSRLGPEVILPNYHLLSLLESKEDKCLKKEVDIKSIYRFDHKRRGKSSTIEVLKSDKGKKFLKKFSQPILYLYWINTKTEAQLLQRKFRYIGSKLGEFSYLRNKIEFFDLLKKLKIDLPPHEIIRVDKLDYAELKNRYDKFVIQLAEKGGGRGTHFIFDEQDFNNFLLKIKNSKLKIRITKYIKGPSPSMTLCITSSGPIVAPLQYQLVSPKECTNPLQGKGCWSGHDWTNSNFPRAIQKQAYSMGQKIGEDLAGKYFGILGIDLLFDEAEQKLYPTECNPRLTGSFPVYPFVQEEKNEPQIIYYHILANLFSNEPIDTQEITKMIGGEKEGSQVLLYNRENKDLEIKSDVECGVYKIEGDELIFTRGGYRLKDIKGENEIIISDGMLFKGKIYRPKRKICRLLTKKGVLADNRRELNNWAKNVVEKIYKMLES